MSSLFFFIIYPASFKYAVVYFLYTGGNFIFTIQLKSGYDELPLPLYCHIIIRICRRIVPEGDPDDNGKFNAYLSFLRPKPCDAAWQILPLSPI